MAYKNAKITADHARRVVQTTWILYIQWEKSQNDVDYHLYLNQLALAKVALSQLRPKEKEDLLLP